MEIIHWAFCHVHLDVWINKEMLGKTPLTDGAYFPRPGMPWERGEWRAINTGGKQTLPCCWSHSQRVSATVPPLCALLQSTGRLLACWWCSCCQRWVVCIQWRGTLQKQWHRHVVLTCCPLVSAYPASLWEPAVTWPGKSLRERRGTLALVVSAIHAPPHTNTDMLNKLHRLIPLCCANMHPLVDTLHNTQHKHVLHGILLSKKTSKSCNPVVTLLIFHGQVENISRHHRGFISGEKPLSK